MKKIIISVIFVLVAIVVIIFSINYVFDFNVKIDTDSFFNLNYIYDSEDNDTSKVMTKEESETIIKILDNKKLNVDFGVSCGFSDKFFLNYNNGLINEKFYLACDGCYIIKYREKYINLTDTEGGKLRQIFNKYKVKVPCV